MTQQGRQGVDPILESALDTLTSSVDNTESVSTSSDDDFDHVKFEQRHSNARGVSYEADEDEDDDVFEPNNVMGTTTLEAVQDETTEDDDAFNIHSGSAGSPSNNDLGVNDAFLSDMMAGVEFSEENIDDTNNSSVTPDESMDDDNFSDIVENNDADEQKNPDADLVADHGNESNPSFQNVEDISVDEESLADIMGLGDDVQSDDALTDLMGLGGDEVHSHQDPTPLPGDLDEEVEQKSPVLSENDDASNDITDSEISEDMFDPIVEPETDDSSDSDDGDDDLDTLLAGDDSTKDKNNIGASDESEVDALLEDTSEGFLSTLGDNDSTYDEKDAPLSTDNASTADALETSEAFYQDALLNDLMSSDESLESRSDNEDSDLPGINRADDLENFLNDLDIPEQTPVYNERKSSIEQDSPAETVTQNQPIENKPLSNSAAEDKMENSPPTSKKPNENRQSPPVPLVAVKQNSKFNFVTLCLVTLLGAGGGFAANQAYQYYKPSDTEAASKIIQQETVRFQQALQDLDRRAKTLEDRLQTSDQKILKVEQYYQSLQQEYAAVMAEQVKLTGNLAELKINADEYEKAMIERLESLLKFTKGISDQVSGQEVRLKDTLFRETIAALESRDKTQDTGQIKALVKTMEANDRRLEQIEVNLQSQKTLLSLMGDETEYVKSRLGQIETSSPPTKTVVETTPPTSAKKATVVTPPTTKVTPTPADTWKVDIKPEPVASGINYILIGVLQKTPGVFEIYLQPSNAKSATEYESYIFSPSEKSVIPGYGVITGVQAVSGNATVVPYQIVTESGIIKGRAKP